MTRLLSIALTVAAIGGATAWLVAAEHCGTPPTGNYSPRTELDWQAPPGEAGRIRLDALKRAAVRVPSGWSVSESALAGVLETSPVVCQFVNDVPGGTTPKFDCALEGGQIVKVKYGRNPEIYAEAAATRLLTILGFGADTVTIVPRLRCYGCPRFPFATMRLLSIASATSLLPPQGYQNRYTDFTEVAIETKFPAPAIQTPLREGWDWRELEVLTASHADVDALRLLAVFLAHWDNKSENQRLVCLDDVQTPPGADCKQPFAFIQDLGSTFGPIKVNLTSWRDLHVWTDARTCAVSMKSLPFRGATFPDRTISEEGRVQLATQLAALTDDQVREIFRQAHFHDYYSGTDDERDLSAWTIAFRTKVDEIVTAGPCA